jgi:hypothetical protein
MESFFGILPLHAKKDHVILFIINLVRASDGRYPQIIGLGGCNKFKAILVYGFYLTGAAD